MSTLSPRLKLTKPLGTEPADIDIFNDNWDRMDATSGLILCTESTKPTVDLFPGMWILCTDTGNHYVLGRDGSGSWAGNVFSGANWVVDYYYTLVAGAGNVMFGLKNSAVGTQSIFSDNSGTVTNASNPTRNGATANQAHVFDVTGSSGSFTGVATKVVNFRGYIQGSGLDAFLSGNSSSTAAPNLYLVIDNTTEILLLTTSDTQDGRSSTARSVSRVSFDYNWTDTAGGAHTYKLRMTGGRTDGGTTNASFTISGFSITGTISA